MVDLGASDLRTFLPSKDYALSTDFYLALGFTREYADDSISLLELGNRRVYLQNGHAKEWAENMMLHITVADAAACHRQVAELLASGRFPGARVAPPRDEPYGARVTYVWDPAGVLLHLAQWL